MLRKAVPLLALVAACKSTPRGAGTSIGLDASELSAVLDEAHEDSEARQKALAPSEARDKTRRGAIARGEKTIAPRPDLGKCPLDVPVPTFAEKATDGKLPADPKADYLVDADATMSSIHHSDAASADGPKRAVLLGLSRSDPAFAAAAKDLSEPERWTYDATFLVDEALAGDVGWVIGRLYVWDYRSERIACTAHVGVRNSTKAPVDGGTLYPLPSKNKQLMHALRNAAIREAITKLVVAGPAIAVDAGKAAGANRP